MNPTGAPGGSYTTGGQAVAAQLLVAGQTYLADFTGHISILLDAARLDQFRSGAANNVELLIQELMFNGVGALICPITINMDPNRSPPPSTLTATTPKRPFPAIQDYIINMNVTIPNLLPHHSRTSSPTRAQRSCATPTRSTFRRTTTSTSSLTDRTGGRE
jgi:hypothetical protein